MRNLRFDMRGSKVEQLLKNEFVLFPETRYKLIENFSFCYNPAEEITVDEQLLVGKSRCRFMQYMANEPDKYVAKIWLANNVKFKYVLNGYPYFGKDEEQSANFQYGENVVFK